MKPIRRRAVVAFVIDVIAVLVFVIIGRVSHHEALGVIGILVTFWPFLAGLVLGWLISRSWRAPFRIFWNAITILLVTVFIGVILRIATGQDAPISFVIVAVIVLAILFIGWRIVAILVTGRPRKS
jgi:hypothetical protein